MGAMMGSTMGAWILLWILLGVAVAVTIGVVVARALGARPKTGPAQIPPAESPAVQEARDALRLRYANGEISREEYLQGKVELGD
jgi:putative membrane protein